MLPVDSQGNKDWILISIYSMATQGGGGGGVGGVLLRHSNISLAPHLFRPCFTFFQRQKPLPFQLTSDSSP